MTVRRDFLAFTAGAVVAKTVLPLAARAAPVHPDAQLLAACAEHDRLERLWSATFEGPDTDDPEWPAVEALRRRISDEQTPWIDLVVDTPATTLEGHQARARSLLLSSPDAFNPEEQHFTHERMVQAIMRDLLGLQA